MSQNQGSTGARRAGIPAADPGGLSEDIAWRPSPAYLERSRLRAFMERHDIHSFDALLERSAADPDWFWDATVKDLDLQFYTPYERVLDISRGWEWATWFTGSSYNYVHDALDKRASGPDHDRPAIIFEGEDGVVRTLTYASR